MFILFLKKDIKIWEAINELNFPKFCSQESHFSSFALICIGYEASNLFGQIH